MINPLDLTGRTVLVTGASSGIGRSTAILLSQLGARLVVTGRDPNRLEKTLEALECSGHLAIPFDLENVDGIAHWLREVVSVTGPLDGLVCCAGVSSLRPLRALDMAHFDKIMRINCHSAVALTTAFCRKTMRQPEASVVLVASVAGIVGAAARGAYSASKGALIAFSRSAAIELAPAGVRVNCVAPAYVKTEMYEATIEDVSAEKAEDLVSAMQPLGLGTPLDVAQSIAFLLAKTGRWITGSVLAVDGGYTAQ